EHRLELPRLEGEERRHHAARGVADEEPDLEPGDGVADGLDEIGAGEVERDRPQLDAVRADLVGGAPQRLAVTVEQEEIEPVRGDLPCPLGPEADGGAGDERTRTVARAKRGRVGHDGRGYGAARRTSPAGWRRPGRRFQK